MAELENLEVLEISIVDEPANERDVLFFKSQGDDNMNNNLEESNFEKTEEFKDLVDGIDFGDEQELKLRASIRTLESLQKDLPDDEYQEIAQSVFGEIVEKNEDEDITVDEVAGKLAEKLELSGDEEEEQTKDVDEGPDQETVESVIQKASDLSDDIDGDTWSELKQELDSLAEEADVDVEISRSDEKPEELDELDDDVAEKVEELWKSKQEENEELRKELQEHREKIQKEKNRKEIQKEKERVKKEFPLLKGKADDFAPKMKNLRDVDEDLYEDVREKLKAANDQLEESGFYEEAGSSEEPEENGDPLEELKSLAKEIKEKSDEELTDEQAFRKATHQNRDLYNKYRRNKQ